MVASLFHAAWIANYFFASGISPVNSYLSAMSATNNWFSPIFRTTDFLSAVCFIAAGLLAIGAMRATPFPDALPVGREFALRPRTWNAQVWLLIGLAAVIATGFATIADVLDPLSCAPTVDPVCRAREEAGTVPLTHKIHSYTSVTVLIAQLVTAFTLTRVERMRRSRWARKLTVALTATIIGAGATGITALLWEYFEVRAALGIVQAVGLIAYYAWLWIYAARLRSRAAALAATTPHPLDPSDGVG